MPGPRAALAKAIPPRRRAGAWLGLALAIVFALGLLPVITAERWLGAHPTAGEPSPITVRVPLLAGFDTQVRHVGGGVVIGRGELATPAKVAEVDDLADAMPRGPLLLGSVLLLIGVLAAIFTHHSRRSTYGRLLRVQLASLGLIAVVAIAVKALLLTTPVSILVVPVALFALVPTLCLDRIVGLATGVLAALVLATLAPFDLGVAILLLVQVAVAGLVVAERPKKRWPAALAAGAASTVCTAVTFPVLHYLTTGHLPASDVSTWQAPWLAAALGPALATVLAVPLVPLYQLLVGEITQGRLVELEDLSNPLLVQIATRSPGTWQHSLAMANLAEIAANAIGANGRLVRVGAYYHDLGKSLQPKYFIENLEPGETSPHDQLPPEVSCDAIFAHVTEGLAAARRAGLHERIVDFMHMHHGNGVLEYFWARCREQGNPNQLTVENFRYPGVPPHSRETAILAICDAVEAASRTLKKPDPAAIDSLVQRIVYGKLHLGQLDDSGLSMGELRRIADSLRETIRHANHGRIEYPWQKEAAAAAAAAAPPPSERLTQTGPRLDSLDRPARPDVVAPPRPTTEAAAAVDGVPLAISGATTGSVAARRPTRGSAPPRVSSPEALAETADLRGAELRAAASATRIPAVAAVAEDNEAALAVDAAPERISRDDVARSETAPQLARPTRADRRTGRNKTPTPGESLRELSPPGDSIGALIEPPLPAPGAKPQAQLVDGPSESPFDDDPELRDTPDARAHRSLTRDARAAIEASAARQESAARPTGPIRAKPPTPGARKRAATLPPMAIRRAPTVPPPMRAPSGGDDDDPDVTQPRLRMPIPAPPTSSPNIKLPVAPWASGLAARIDAAIESFHRPGDDFGGETPVIAPTAAELRALIGIPDPTRQQSIEELERLHFEARNAEPSEPEILQVRRLHPTAEVDPDDIESAIELAPPARRKALALGIAKKKPSE